MGVWMSLTHQLGNHVITSGTFAVMDPAAPFWQTFVRDRVLDLQRDFGVDGVYLDMWSGSGYGFDYDPTHGHPADGGNYIAQGMRAQVSFSVQLRLRFPQRAFGVLGLFSPNESASDSEDCHRPRKRTAGCAACTA